MDIERHKFIYKYLIYISIAILFTALWGVNAEAKDSKTKNILIINSYQKNLAWTDEQTDGIMDILKKDISNCNISVEYMDWKNYPTKENIQYAYSYLKYKYSKKYIDIVVTTDDAALEFALANRAELFSNAPVVFCGVNKNGVQRITSGYSNVIGITEEVDAERTIKAALEINPNLKEIYVVFDNTESGLSTGAIAFEAIYRAAPGVRAVTVNEGKYSDVLEYLKQVPKDSIILVTTYYMDNEGKVIGFEESCDGISEKSPVPVFHLYDFGMGHGAIGGSMLSGRLQGEEAGKIAARILKGENMSQMVVNASKTTRYIFDYAQLKRFNIPLDKLPKGSKLANRPFSFLETYKNLVIMVAVIFSILISFICILIFYLRKISTMKQKLHESHEELSQLYEELTASDEELRQQFDELTEVQKSLMSSEERYALLFEKMMNGFFVFEPVLENSNKLVDMRFVTVNPGFEIHTNKKASEMPGKTWLEVFKYPNRDLGIYEDILQTGEAKHFEAYYPDGNVYYLLNAFKIKDNQIGVAFDNITEYKKSIKEVRKLNDKLEEMVIERTNELQNAVDELEAFAYTVSHDLKSPLRAVDGYSRIILEDYERELPEETVEMILNIRSICSDMIDMISKLLKYSTTTRAILCKEKINIEEMFLNIFNELKSVCQHRKIELKIETGLPEIIGDRILLKQAIYNILSNAMKFTKDRENAVIAVGNTLTEKEYMFYIRDNGVGFDMKYSSKLFGIFQRLHTSDEFEGSGIGLVTVRKIIEKHGGRVWIEGEVDKGATFYFTLPFAEEGVY